MAPSLSTVVTVKNDACILDLRKSHKVRRHGDLLAIYTWVNDERALVLVLARRNNPAWFVVCESAAYRYDDASMFAEQYVTACEVFGVEPSQRNWVRIASMIHWGLGDLIRMPSAPTPEFGPSVGMFDWPPLPLLI